MTKIVHLDCETNGLLPLIHRPGEVAAIVEEPGKAPVEHVWLLPVDLTHADPRALNIGGFWERHPQGTGVGVCDDPAEVASQLARILVDAVVIGSNPTFDKDMLTPFLAEHGWPWPAHYRTVDVITLGAGAMEDVPALPFSSHEVSRAFGVDPADYDRHTALGDCRWTAALYKAITRKGADQ